MPNEKSSAKKGKAKPSKTPMKDLIKEASSKTTKRRRMRLIRERK